MVFNFVRQNARYDTIQCNARGGAVRYEGMDEVEAGGADRVGNVSKIRIVLFTLHNSEMTWLFYSKFTLFMRVKPWDCSLPLTLLYLALAPPFFFSLSAFYNVNHIIIECTITLPQIIFCIHILKSLYTFCFVKQKEKIVRQHYNAHCVNTSMHTHTHSHKNSCWCCCYCIYLNLQCMRQN